MFLEHRAAPVTNRADEYRGLAVECLQLASETVGSDLRSALIEMAQHWARLAEWQDTQQRTWPKKAGE